MKNYKGFDFARGQEYKIISSKEKAIAKKNHWLINDYL